MIEKLFLPKLKNVPRKKFRGKKRYFRNLVRDAKEFRPSLENDDWYDMWHYHADWEGYGNFGWKYRLKHIEALCIIYEKFAYYLKSYGKPHQLWIYLNQDDAGQDAVFFHTHNPNGDNFPCKFDDTQWGIPTIEHYFAKLMPSFNFRSGQQEWDGSQIFFIFSSAIGEPIE
jgi:hypothetical protein